MKKVLILLLLLTTVIPVFALYTIKGKIVDASTQAPLDFVNIALFKQDAAAPTAGVSSDEKGEFLLPQVPKGKYTLRVSFVGYNTINLPLNVTDKELNMGMIKLIENSKTLSEVEVIGQGTQMRFDIDKKVFTVDQNIASAGGSATEVLQNIPSVDVDNEGNVSLRNSSSVEVWINGKPSGLTADNRAQILQQMPAESIESIEIMTNPSAKFNPEGTAGIINLVLKKNRKAGYYGSISAGIMYSDGGKPGGTLGANLNYSSSKVDAYLNLGYRAMNFTGGSNTDRYNLSGTDTISLLNQTNTMNRSFGGLFMRGGVDYHLDDKNTLSLGGFGMLGSGNSTSGIVNKISDYANGMLLKDYIRDNTESEGHPGMNVSLDYKHDIDKKGSNFMASLSYSQHKRNSENRYIQTDLLGNNTSDITQANDGQNKELQLKADYTKKLTESSRLEAGWQSTIQKRLSPASGIDNVTNTELKQYFNIFDYKEQNHAAYLTYGDRFFKKLSVQAGLRAEYLTRGSSYTYKDENDNWDERTITIEPKSSLQLFPSAYLSYSLPKNNELQLNYTRRVNRPRGRQINPFRDFSDSTNISYGNSDLDPEYSTALEFNYIKSWDNHSLSASTYYRFTDNVIQRVSFINDGTMESTYMNVSKSSYWGAELVAKNRLFKIVNLTSSLNFYYNKMDSSTYENPYDPTIRTTIPAQNNFSWSGRVMANVMLGRTTSGQISGEYSAPRVIAQGKQTASYSIDLGLRKTFFDRNLSLNFMVRDLLNSRKRNTITWGDGFYQTNESYFHGRMIGLTATYNFGNMKPKQSDRKKTESQSDMNLDSEME
ncbi:MAG: TonB-dependent receptor [Bacteroidales bacterium]|nr:TonB-dependent receptor [Bacteroidales bacterium]